MAVDMRHQQRGAVRRLLGHIGGGDRAGRAGLVFHKHAGIPHDPELLPDHARQHVSAATGGKTHHDAHRPLHVSGGARQAGHRQSGRRGQDELSALHCVSP
ncbi:hypothetical protein D3C81_1672050 [compost metagenome]